MALRIKDNVDLKELEKFGFSPSFVSENGLPFKIQNYSKTLNYIKNNGGYTKVKLKIIEIDTEIRIIKIRSLSSYHYNAKSSVKDLIKADLVEKVEE